VSSEFARYSLMDLASEVVDNRGRSCPTADVGIPLIATNCIKPDHLYPVFENIRFVDDKTYESWFRGHPEPGDILFVCKGSPGRVALVPDPVPFCIAQDMVSIRANDELAYPRYLYYVLKNPKTLRAIENMHVGTMIPHFKKGDFKNLHLDIHSSLGRQRGIAEVLGALDDKIAANRKLAATADQLAVATVKGRQMDGHSVVLADVASVTMGTSPPGDTYNEDGTGMVFYQGNRDFGFRSPANRVWTVEPKRVAHPGDTLLSVRAPVGQLNVASEETCIGRGLAALRSTVGTPSVLYYRLKAATGLWESYESGGTIFGSINGKELNALTIPGLAGSAEALERQISALDRAIASAEAEVVTLSSMRDTLLPRLMSGELRVRDAEKVVENVL